MLRQIGRTLEKRGNRESPQRESFAGQPLVCKKTDSIVAQREAARRRRHSEATLGPFSTDGNGSRRDHCRGLFVLRGRVRIMPDAGRMLFLCAFGLGCRGLRGLATPSLLR